LSSIDGQYRGPFSAVEVRANRFVNALGGVRRVAQYLIHGGEPLARQMVRRHLAEGHGIIIARLRLEVIPVDRLGREARGGAGLEPAEFETEAPQSPAHSFGRPFADAPAFRLRFAGVHEPAHERAGREHDRAGLDRFAVDDHACAARVFRIDENLIDACIDDLDRPRAQNALDFTGIAILVGLRPGPVHRRAARGVQHAELDAGRVDRPAHDPAERVDLADDLALGEPADRGVAGHRADFGGVHGDQRDGSAHPGRRPRGFGPGVPASDHDDVETLALHVSGE